MLPTSRDLTYSFGVTPVSSTNLNSIQDVLVAINNLLTGAAQAFWSGVTLAVGLTAAPNQNITVSGTGAFKHGTRTLIINGAAFSDTTTGAIGQYRLTTVASYAGILIESGKTITAMRLFTRDNATGPNVVGLSLQTAAGFAAPSITALATSSLGNGTDQTLSLGGLSIAVSAGNTYSLVVTLGAGSAVRIYRAEVDYIG